MTACPCSCLVPKNGIMPVAHGRGSDSELAVLETSWVCSHGSETLLAQDLRALTLGLLVTWLSECVPEQQTAGTALRRTF